jgi:replication initiation and membrane attachment protein DnaB
MTNIYTNNANTNDSAKNTLDFFENYNKQQINLKSSDIDQFQSLLVKKGMQELAARETTTLILKQCNIDEVDPQTIYSQLKETPNMELTDLLGEILNINRPVSSTLGTKLNFGDNNAKRNIIDGV